jgi:hypothetical protein
VADEDAVLNLLNSEPVPITTTFRGERGSKRAIKEESRIVLVVAGMGLGRVALVETQPILAMESFECVFEIGWCEMVWDVVVNSAFPFAPRILVYSLVSGGPHQDVENCVLQVLG